jgi:DNA-binding NarL/FixJ family response regulator
MLISETTILAVGIRDRDDALEELPVRLLSVDRAAEALPCLRDEDVHTVVSKWNLTDMGGGEFLKRVIEAKPQIPTIGFISPGNDEQEIAARALGVNIVLPEDIDDGHFRQAVCQVLGLNKIASISAADDYKYFESELAHSSYSSFKLGLTASDQAAEPGRV